MNIFREILLAVFPRANHTEPIAENPMNLPIPQPNPDILFPDWSVVDNAHHNVRAICDLEALSYDEKEVLTACVMVESGFMIGATHINYAFTSEGVKYIASTDYGIVQVNDYWHIGPGKDFPSATFVMANSEACVRWMCQYYRTHGNLNAWVSYTSGEYRQYLGNV